VDDAVWVKKDVDEQPPTSLPKRVIRDPIPLRSRTQIQKQESFLQRAEFPPCVEVERKACNCSKGREKEIADGKCWMWAREKRHNETAKETSNREVVTEGSEELHTFVVDEVAHLIPLESGTYSITWLRGLLLGQSRLRKSAQDDKWSFCLTAGTLCPANQEKQ
jgi:hypothetical protein